jgi:hypothetical protein
MTQERTDETDDAMVAPAVQPDAFGTLLSLLHVLGNTALYEIVRARQLLSQTFQQRKAVATRAAKARWHRPRVVGVK